MEILPDVIEVEGEDDQIHEGVGYEKENARKIGKIVLNIIPSMSVENSKQKNSYEFTNSNMK